MFKLSYFSGYELVTYFNENLEEAQKFICTKCLKAYNHKRDLLRHEKFVCGKEPTFQCPFCSKMCTLKFNLKNHVLVKHSDQIKSFDDPALKDIFNVRRKR